MPHEPEGHPGMAIERVELRLRPSEMREDDLFRHHGVQYRVTGTPVIGDYGIWRVPAAPVGPELIGFDRSVLVSVVRVLQPELKSTDRGDDVGS